MRWMWLMGVMACGTAPEVAPKGPPVDPVAAAAQSGVVEQAKRALQACSDAVVVGRSAETVAQQGWGIDADGLASGCGEAWRMYDTLAPEHAGTQRGVDRVLAGLARVADTLDLVLVQLEAEAPESRANAFTQLSEALDAAKGHADKVGASPPQRYQEPKLALEGPEGAWARTVGNDDNGVGALPQHLSSAYFVHGGNRALVRDRGVSARIAAARAELKAREEGIAALALPEAVLTARRGYLDAVGAALATYADVVAAWAGEASPDDAARADQQARIAASHAAWSTAWEAEKARIAAAAPVMEAPASPGVVPDEQAP